MALSRPEGHHTVTPAFIVPNAPAVVEVVSKEEVERRMAGMYEG